ncbi:MAG TPA: BNR-4 repeat-containing protein, partial [Tepidisphaeraceae bacterium]|nr:BNR-4 repeat-containing protein [Tepidisphaeraceae bacterium]
STKPYSIDAFERIAQTSFSYGQPWYFAGHGFLFINNRYTDGRAVAFQTSADGREWSLPKLLAQFKGHYQISAPSPDGKKLGVAFDYHPHGLDTRTNLYYIETSDFGRSWHNIKGEKLDVPLKEVRNSALVHDYESEGLLQYLKDIQFDANGRPIVVYLTSKGPMPGEQFGPHQWHTAQWTGESWRIRDAMISDHNYDFGQLYLENDGWKIIAPTDAGPSPNWTGGDIVMWTSPDEGATWNRLKTLTHDPRMHHNFVREPINANPHFYAFWADGDPSKPSDSHLYFTDREGSHVWKLPEEMKEESMRPQVVDWP